MADEDVAEFNNGTWTMYFDASARGLSTGIDLDAISVVNGVLYFSVNSTTGLRTGLSGDVNDIYAWTGGNNVSRVVTLGGTGSPNMDSLVYTDTTHFLTGFSDTDTTLPAPVGRVQDEDIVEFNAGTWSVWFDGTAAGLTSSSQDIDAFSLPGATVTPPPPPPPVDPPAPAGNGNGSLTFSTTGSANPDGVTGTADAADLYGFDNAANPTTTRKVDATVDLGLPGYANVDGFDQVGTTYYLSFASNTRVPTLGFVQDEDIVSYDTVGKTWTVWFDGTAHGLTSNAQDIDAISIVPGSNTFSFSTLGNTNPPNVTGSADNADIYSWNGSSYSRVWDATASNIPSAADVDGIVRTDATHFYLSFRTDTTVPGLGRVQDEDVVYNNSGAWELYFDGTAHGLTAPAAEVDAFDIP